MPDPLENPSTDEALAVAFQSTPLRRGATKGGGKLSPPFWSFNPRPRTRYPSAACQVSIHAPARGATPRTITTWRTLRFQSTPPRGGRQQAKTRSRPQIAFQSTPPRGGRLWVPLTPLWDAEFQSTPPRGGRPLATYSFLSLYSVFQSTPPRGGRRRFIWPHPCHCGFQSTPPRGGRRRFIWPHPCHCGFQSTPPRGGRPKPIRDTNRLYQVSIHAPARGATDRPDGNRARPLVSIHAPARGATRRSFIGPLERPVSIHAPARGATPLEVSRIFVILFQSTPPRGGRRSPAAMSLWTKRSFNPRPRAGGDAFARSLPSGTCGFNPRPRAGGDMHHDAQHHPRSVSIHAPARGATKVLSLFQFSKGFQSTPPRGGRRWKRWPASDSASFNPRPRAGGDDRRSMCPVR